MAINNSNQAEWLGLRNIRAQVLTSCAILLEFLIINFLAE